MGVTAPAVKPNHARFTLAEIVAATGGALSVSAVAGLEIEGVVSDTRADLKGALFVALRGARFDGHSYLQQAQEQGALAAVVAADFEGEAPQGLPLISAPDTTVALGDLGLAHRRKFDIPVIGVTGSYGKTTTRALIVAALGTAGVLSSAGNNNNEIGVPQTLLQLNKSHRFAVIEMGMRGAGQIAELARIAEPTVGVITNVGPQHIEFFENLGGVAAAKGELLRTLPDDGTAVLPGDSPFVDELRELSMAGSVTFGTENHDHDNREPDDYRAEAIQPTGDGISFMLRDPHGAAKCVALSLPGAHNAVNAAAAVAVACELGVDFKTAAAALSSVDVPGARLRVVRAGEITILDDSYNAGPDSMRAALNTLQSYTATRHIAALGSMKELGRWTEEEHRKLGEAAAFADELAWVGEETRAAQKLAGGAWYATAEEAGAALAPGLMAGDCILVKGSRSVGMEKIIAAIESKTQKSEGAA